MSEFRVRIRGVYATALTKLLLDAGFKIVQPSEKIRERFNLENNFEPMDLNVDDKNDKQGVIAVGNPDATMEFKKIITEELEDAIIRVYPISIHAIYKGKVLEAWLDGGGLIDLGSKIGVLDKCESLNPEEKEVLVQVKETKFKGRPILTKQISIAGDYAVLIPSDRIEVSKRIHGEERERLVKLGEEIAPLELGLSIRWRTAAKNKPEEILREEIKRLTDEWVKIIKKFNSIKAPTLIKDGNIQVEVEFPYSSKIKLDEIRAKVTPTLRNHHYYRACGGIISDSLSMAEKLLEEGYPQEKVEKLFLDAISREYPMEGSKIMIHHTKLDGTHINLGYAVVESLDLNNGNIKLVREIKSSGIYDGLGIRKEAGDKAITETKIGALHTKTFYISRKGQFKGAYINLNTPVELYPNQIRYVDLEVDICILPNGDIKIVDEKKLKEAVEEGIVSSKLAEKVSCEIEKLIEKTKDVTQLLSTL